MNDFEPNEPATGRSPVYGFGEFRLDLSAEALWRGDESLSINRRMFQVLSLLIERNGEIVSKEEFFEKVWGGSFVEDNNLTVTIRSLRKLLGDDAKQARFIENIPRKGYRFIAPVKTAAAPLTVRTAGGIADTRGSETSVVDPQPVSRLLSRPVLVLATVLVIALIAAAAVDYKGLFLSEQRPAPIVTIAVLPFSSSAGEGEIFTQGFTESLMDTLTKVRGLRVIDRNSTIQAARETGDTIQAARRVNAAKVLTGSVSQVSDDIVIDVELTDVASNSKVFATRLRQPANEPSRLQREIVAEIAKTLHYELSENEKARISRRPTENTEAYSLYIKGRYYWNKRTDPDIRRSIEFFKQAVDLDPTFALAYVGLADAYTLGELAGTGIEKKDRIAMARGFAQKALDIDDTLGDAYASLGINKTFIDWDFAGAEQDYSKAIELNPGDATAHHWLAELLAMQGRFDESIGEYDVALTLDPLSFPIRLDKALTYYYAHDFDKAIEQLNTVKALDPDYVRTYEFLYFTYREKRSFTEAIDAWETLFERQIQRGIMRAESRTAYLRLIKDLREGFRQSGEKGYWRAFVRSDAGKTFDAYNLAIAHAKLGDTDAAMTLLEQALAEHSTSLVWVKVAPELDPLRGDQRFRSLLKRVGFE